MLVKLWGDSEIGVSLTSKYYNNLQMGYPNFK